MDITPHFQPGQIVSLEDGECKLYAEVIQVVASRQLCWVRPLLLVTNSSEASFVNDVRETSDLLWPIDLFQPALDTEVISILSEILIKDTKSEIDSTAKQRLHQFIHQLWQAQKEGLGTKD